MLNSIRAYSCLERENLNPCNPEKPFDKSWLTTLKYVGLVKKIVRGYLDCGLEFEDLVQEGLLGARDAIRRYGKRTDINLTTYIGYRIHNYIQIAIREQGCAAYIPNDAFFDARKITRFPGHTKSLTRGQRNCAESARRLFSGNVRSYSGDEVLLKKILKDYSSEYQNYSLDLRDALERLPEREKEIILSFYYYPCLRLDQIAEKLGISRALVIRVKRRAMNRLGGFLCRGESYVTPA